jgi:phenylpropionate dioxygenase-like ring-hydroxylating dioxygenase large terminal subunit
VDSCLENFLDCPHTVFVHKGWFRSHDTRELKAVVRTNGTSIEVEFQGEPISKSLVSRLFFPKGRELRHIDQFIMPNLSRVDYDFGPNRHFIISSQCTPLGEHETEVYTVITYTFGTIGSLVRLVLEPICRKIIRQDVEVLRVQTEQVKRFGGPRFAHVETDLLGLKIQSMRRRAEQKQAAREQEDQRAITICF